MSYFFEKIKIIFKKKFSGHEKVEIWLKKNKLFWFKNFEISLKKKFDSKKFKFL